MRNHIIFMSVLFFSQVIVAATNNQYEMAKKLNAENPFKKMSSVLVNIPNMEIKDINVYINKREEFKLPLYSASSKFPDPTDDINGFSEALITSTSTQLKEKSKTPHIIPNDIPLIATGDWPYISFTTFNNVILIDESKNSSTISFNLYADLVREDQIYWRGHYQVYGGVIDGDNGNLYERTTKDLAKEIYQEMREQGLFSFIQPSFMMP